MTPEEEARIVELGGKAHGALIDALTPLITSKGIVALEVIALVSKGEGVGFPVRLVLAINPEAAATVQEAAAVHLSGADPMVQEVRFQVPVPVKQ